MSFGKRQGEQPRWLEEDELEERLEQRFSGKSQSSGVGAKELLGGGALVAVAFGATFYLMDAAPTVSVSKAPAPVLVSDSEPKPVARTYTRDPDFPVVEPDATKVAFTMVVTETGFDAIDSELHEQCMKPVGADMARRAEATGSVLMDTDAGGQYIACTMKIYKNRFCQPFYKERLVKRLTEFVRVRQTMAANLEHNWNQANEELMQYGLRNADSNKPKLPPVVPGPLATQIYELSSQGILAPGDFDWASGGSKALGSYFAEPGRQVCG